MSKHPFVIDHLYITVEENKFTQLKEELIQKYDAEHRIYNPPSGEAGWEGLYVYSNEGTYFEVLKASSEFGHGKIGIALSHRDQNFETFEYCKANFPDIEVKEYKNSMGEPWFTAIYKQDVPEHLDSLVWIMSYDGKYKTGRFLKKNHFQIERFKKIKLFTSPGALHDLKLFSDWLPETSLFELVPVDDHQAGFEIVYGQ